MADLIAGMGVMIFLKHQIQGNELVLGTGSFTVECWVYDDNSHDGNNMMLYLG